jgi:hypothetical protein
MPRKKLQLLLERFSLTCKKNRGLFRVNKSIEIDENLLANLIAKCCQIPIIFFFVFNAEKMSPNNVCDQLID